MAPAHFSDSCLARSALRALITDPDAEQGPGLIPELPSTGQCHPVRACGQPGSAPEATGPTLWATDEDQPLQEDGGRVDQETAGDVGI